MNYKEQISEDDKIYFLPGQRVRLKQKIANSPDMVVVSKVSNVFKHQTDQKGNALKGIKCMWFNTLMELQEAIFNTKDLEKID